MTQAGASSAAREVDVLRVGRSDYAAVLNLQRRLVVERRSGRLGDLLILTEHDPVITTGRGADFRNLLANAGLLTELGVPQLQVERGGDITYHGPGQLVAYPILDLRAYGRDVHAYVRRLEETAMAVLRVFGVDGERRLGAPGIYAGSGKLASVGIAVRGWMSFHGLAINLSAATTYFALVRPCGLQGIHLTSVEDLTGHAPDHAEACSAFVASFGRLFERRMVETSRSRELVRLAASPLQGS